VFDRVEDYDSELGRGLALAGEDKAYFQRGRLRALAERLPPGFAPREILDFGCGLGDTAPLLAAAFPGSRVVGVDASEASLALARERHASERISFAPPAGVAGSARFDLAYCNGVFHHIAPGERPAAASEVASALAGGGYFALFENSPFNPGTRLVMRRIPFDRDAVLLTPGEARRLLRAAGLACAGPVRYLFVFPRLLARLRPLERRLDRWPLGGQFWLLGRRPERGPAAASMTPS
jgi:SAM-dependent methyltransferase